MRWFLNFALNYWQRKLKSFQVQKKTSRRQHIWWYQFIYRKDNFVPIIKSVHFYHTAQYLLYISFEGVVVSCSSILDMRHQIVTFWQASYAHQTSAVLFQVPKNELVDNTSSVNWIFDWNIRKRAENGTGVWSDDVESGGNCRRIQWNSPASRHSNASRGCVDGDGYNIHRSVRTVHHINHLPVEFEERED